MHTRTLTASLWALPMQDGEEPVGRKKGKEQDMEMELTFKGGLEDLGQRLLSKKQERQQRQKDTVWEAYERRRRCDITNVTVCCADTRQALLCSSASSV